jgi:hypothetical protein
MTTTFETAKIGDQVFSHTFGWGVILDIDKSNYYPIQAVFGTTATCHFFTLEGFHYKGNPSQCLFWDECTIEAPAKPVTMKLVHGIEVPDISFHPTDGTAYYYPATNDDMYSTTTYYSKYLSDRFRSDNNLCYPYTKEGKQAAILHAKAMLGIPV